MTNVVQDLLGWFAGAMYVLIALAIVYLYFWKLVPIIIAKESKWDVFSVFRVTVVLGLAALLLGGVAVFTADWIFSSVLDTLPRTRMAREINRVTGAVIPLTVNDPGLTLSLNPPASVDAGASASALGSPGSSGLSAGSIVTNPSALTSSASTAYKLKENALQLWAATLQAKYNPTNNYRDNRQVMTKRDIPEGVVCDVAAVSGGWLSKRNEQWNLNCSDDGFRSSVPIEINGTAARGLTGGSFYSAEAPFTIYGSGVWPEVAYEVIAAPTPTPVIVPATPGEGGPSGGGAAPTAASGNASSGQAGASAQAGAAAVGGEHTVARGESLGSIADRYSVSVRALIEANASKYPQLRANPNVISVGWKLVIPQQ